MECRILLMGNTVEMAGRWPNLEVTFIVIYFLEIEKSWNRLFSKNATNHETFFQIEPPTVARELCWPCSSCLIFEMAAMPFPCNGILLRLRECTFGFVNVFNKLVSCPIPYFDFQFQNLFIYKYFLLRMA